ncbi:hypothetical protein Tco_0134399 [Tanacetum coccineum]
MEAHLSPNPPIQVNKIASSCEICSGPHDTQYCMEHPEQAFVDYASSREQDRNSSPRRVHFVNTITIVRKEEESKEVKPLKLDSDDLHLNRNDGNPVDKESEASEIVIDEKELSDH